MQTLTRTNVVTINDFDHMTTMDENVKWMTLTPILSRKLLHLRAPCCTSTFTSVKRLFTFNSLLDVHTREKQHLSLMYTMYANASHNTPSYTHVTLYVIQKVHPWAFELYKSNKMKPGVNMLECLESQVHK